MTEPMPVSAESLEETVDVHGAYPELSEGQIAMLVGRGDRRSTKVGDVLYRAGDRPYDFVVVLEGKVAVVEGYQSPAERVVGVHGAQRFLGEIGLLTGQAALATAVVAPGDHRCITSSRGVRKAPPGVVTPSRRARCSRGLDDLGAKPFSELRL